MNDININNKDDEYCFDGDLKILAGGKYISIKEAYENNIPPDPIFFYSSLRKIKYIINNVKFIKSFKNEGKGRIIYAGKRKCVRVRTKYSDIICTPNCKPLMRKDGEYELESSFYSIDYVYRFDGSIHMCTTNNLNKIYRYILAGYIYCVCDTSYLYDDSYSFLNIPCTMHVIRALKHEEIEYSYNEERTIIRITDKNFLQFLKDIKMSSFSFSERTFPEEYKNFTILQKSSFLRGCFTSYLFLHNNNNHLIFESKNLNMIKDISEHLYNDFNIDSVVVKKNKNKASQLEIRGAKNISYFLNTIGIEIYLFVKNVKKSCRNHFPVIRGYEDCGERDVYIIKEPVLHAISVEGHIFKSN